MAIMLEIRINKNVLIKVQGENKRKSIEQAAFFCGLPTECPLCEKPAELEFFHATPRSYEYWGLRCKGQVRHKCNFGQKKEGDHLYYDPKKWEVDQYGQSDQDRAPGPVAPPPAYDFQGEAPPHNLDDETF